MKSTPISIYDDPKFFEAYQDLRQSDCGLNGDLEIPAVNALLPDLQGLSVVDLGCGFGDFARRAVLSGAQSVLAIDASAKMLAKARELTDTVASQTIDYQHLAIEDWCAQPDSIDVLVSSMALHYVNDYQDVVRQMALALKKGGCLIITVEHPVCTANPSLAIEMDDGTKAWPLRSYHDESERLTHWFIDGVKKYHRTVSHYVNALLAANLTLLRLEEPQPTNTAQIHRADWSCDMLNRPPVLLLMAQKTF